MADRVGLDIGKSSLKYCGDRGMGEIPSYRSRGKLTQIIVGGSNAPSLSVKFRGVDWILGEGAPLGTNFSWPTDEKKGNERNLILILAALAKLGVSDADVIVGLPVTTADHKKEVESVKATFNGAHVAVINGISTGVQYSDECSRRAPWYLLLFGFGRWVQARQDLAVPP